MRSHDYAIDMPPDTASPSRRSGLDTDAADADEDRSLLPSQQAAEGRIHGDDGADNDSEDDNDAEPLRRTSSQLTRTSSSSTGRRGGSRSRKKRRRGAGAHGDGSDYFVWALTLTAGISGFLFGCE